MVTKILKVHLLVKENPTTDGSVEGLLAAELNEGVDGVPAQAFAAVQ